MSIKGYNIKDSLISQVAEDLQQPEKVVETVINHQFKHAFQSMSTNKQVEISGFGTFVQSKPKIKRRIKKLEEMKNALIKDPSISAQKKKLDGVCQDLENFYSKL